MIGNGHGKPSPRGWRLSPEFGDLFGPVPDPLRPYLLSFRHALVNLARIEAPDLPPVFEKSP